MGPEVAGPKFSGELGGQFFHMKMTHFWRPGKTTAVLSNGFVQKNMAIPETQKKKG